MSESALADLKLAVTEVCGNAVRHAYADGAGVVRVLFTIDTDRIEVEVEDDGPGIPVEEIPDERRVGEELLEKGMGLSISRAVVDELVVADGAGGRGTVVRLTKRLVG